MQKSRGGSIPESPTRYSAQFLLSRSGPVARLPCNSAFLPPICFFLLFRSCQILAASATACTFWASEIEDRGRKCWSGRIGALAAQPLREKLFVREDLVEEAVVETGRGEDSIAKFLMLLKSTSRQKGRIYWASANKRSSIVAEGDGRRSIAATLNAILCYVVEAMMNLLPNPQERLSVS